MTLKLCTDKFSNNIEELFNDESNLEEGIADIADLPDKKTLKNKLERLLEKELRVKWEVTTLEKYIKEKITPRGLRFFKEPTFDKENANFMLKGIL